jgi:capsular exopolysaccharide synthesis family protein
MNTMEFRPKGTILGSPDSDGAPRAQASSRNPGGQNLPILTQYLSILRRRKWVIIGAIVIALLAGFLVNLLMTPQYTASSTLEIQRETRNFTNVEGVEPVESATIDQEFYQTQYGLLEARSLADRVATNLRLFDNVEFFEMFGSPRVSQWFEDNRVVAGRSTREQRIRECGNILLLHVRVSPQRLSRLVDINFTSPDPAFSKQIVDTWGALFVEMTLQRRIDATAYARRFLEGRLVQLRSRIEESERLLVDYAGRQRIVNLPATTPLPGEGVSGTSERPLLADDLATINRELARATADRALAESRLGSQGGSVTEALENNAITGLRQRRAELSAEYARLMVQFEPDYPPARAVQTQIQQLDQSITREEARVRNTLRETYRASLARQSDLRQQVDQLKAGLLDLRRRSIQYNIYQREVDTNRELYAALLQRYKEIGVAGGVGVNNISIVDMAELPQKPSSPRILLNMILALLAGLGIGIAAAFALEQIDEGIADPADVEENLNVPLLGTVPRIPDGHPLEALRDRKSALAEAYLSLQTNLSFTTDHGVPRTLAITSTSPGEGKTTTSYALAHSLARAKRRILLIDSDMRSPSIHRTFDEKNVRGLSNYLSGEEDISKLISPTPYANLFIMTAGPQPPSAAELLSSDRLERLIEKVSKDFDHVIIDAPPVMGLADAPLIGSRVEGVVFVLEAHRVKKSTARVALGRLIAANSQIIGVVLSKFDVKRAHYGYGYDYGYGYGYGDTAKAQA